LRRVVRGLAELEGQPRNRDEVRPAPCLRRRRDPRRCDIRTFIGGEEHDSGRNFVGFTSAAKWNLRDELVGRLLGLLRSEACILKCWSLDWSGAYRIHADFAVFQLHGPATREAAHSRFARGVDGKRWHSHHVRD